jgi:hypothetical protein
METWRRDVGTRLRGESLLLSGQNKAQPFLLFHADEQQAWELLRPAARFGETAVELLMKRW